MGLRADFLRESVKRVVQTRHTGDVMSSDYWIIGIHQWFVPILGCVCSHIELRVRRLFEMFCLNLTHRVFEGVNKDACR